MGHALVAVQVALSFVLVFGSMLFVRTLVTLTGQEIGFESSRVLVGTVDVRGPALGRRVGCSSIGRSAKRSMPFPAWKPRPCPLSRPSAALPGTTRSRCPDCPGRRRVLFNAVSPGFFRALATPFLAGRDIDDRDRPGSPDVVVVNEAFTASYFRGDNPVGKTFTIVG